MATFLEGIIVSFFEEKNAPSLHFTENIRIVMLRWFHWEDREYKKKEN